MRRKGLLAFITGLFFVLFCSSLSFADEDPHSYNNTGIYIGPTLQYNTIYGDFNSSNVFGSAPPDPEEVIFTADPDNAWGLGMVLGYRGPNYAAEFSYMNSEHDDFSDFLGKGKSELNVISFDLKYFFLSRTPVQPYILAGGSYIWFEQKGLAFTPTEIADADYSNFAVDVGGGLSLFVTPSLFLNGGVVYRWTQFHHVKGTNKWEILDDSLEFSVLSYNLGVSYIFGIK